MPDDNSTDEPPQDATTWVFASDGHEPQVILVRATSRYEAVGRATREMGANPIATEPERLADLMADTEHGAVTLA